MAKRRGYPWNILEIDATRDEISIKKAYASKLRSTRPEDDQEAFQALIQARDAAISRCSTRAPKTRHKIVKAKKSNSATSKSAGNIKHSDKQVAEPKVAVPESYADYHNADVDKNLERQEAVLRDLREVLSPTQDAPSYVQAELAIEKLRYFPIDARAEIEPELLTLVADSIQSVLHSRFEVDKTGRRRFHTKKSVILDLDAEFGWSKNDRDLSYMHSSLNDRIADQLQLLLNPRSGVEYSGQPKQMSWWQKSVGVVVLIWFALQMLSKILGYK